LTDTLKLAGVAPPIGFTESQLLPDTAAVYVTAELAVSEIAWVDKRLDPTCQWKKRLSGEIAIETGGVPEITVTTVGKPLAAKSETDGYPLFPAASVRVMLLRVQAPASAACGMVTLAWKTPFLLVPEILVMGLAATCSLPEGLVNQINPQLNPVPESVIPRSTENVAADELTLTCLGVIATDTNAGGVMSLCVDTTVTVVGKPRAAKSETDGYPLLPAPSIKVMLLRVQRPASAAWGMVTLARKTPFLLVPEIIVMGLALTRWLPEGLVNQISPQLNPVPESVIPRSTENVAADELTLTWLGVIAIEVIVGGVTSVGAERNRHPGNNKRKVFNISGSYFSFSY
jgi:hypothetical protein